MIEGEKGGPPEAVAETNGVTNNKTRLAVVGVVLVLALGYLIYAAFPGNTLYYLTVDEFLADETNLDGRSLRVVGKLAPDSFQRVEGTTLATFALVDKSDALPSIYDGVLPDLFFNPHSDIVLEGSYGDGGVFHTDTVIVKCPSKYQALREGEEA
jgi:cytochrome c-type biogenesis protein CcmE